MESTKLVKHSASDQSHGTFVVQRRHMQKNCETCWIQNKNLDGVIDLPWGSRFVHTKRKKINTEKIKKSLGEKQVLEKENSKENLQGNKEEEESRAAARQAATQHKVPRITATGRGAFNPLSPEEDKKKNLVRQKNNNMETRVCQTAI
jgi:hypothetical protein